MTNEDYAATIQQGETRHIKTLWDLTKGLVFKYTWAFYRRNNARCIQCGITPDDLQQEGFLALLEAVKAFKPNGEYKFTAYFNYPLKNHCNALIGIRGSQRTEPLNQSTSLDETIGGEESTATRLEMLEDPLSSLPFETVEEGDTALQLDKALKECLSKLDPKESDVLIARYYKGLTLQQQGKVMGVSLDRVRQIQAKGLRNLRKPQHAHKLRVFLDDMVYTEAYNGTGFDTWKYRGSVEERLVERLETATRGYTG